MENQALTVLTSLGLPNEDSGVNDLTYRDALSAVPLLAALEEHADDFSNGVKVALSHIYDAFVDVGMDDRLRSIGPEDMRRVDAMMRDGAMEDLHTEIPAVKDLMDKEGATEFDTGVVLAVAMAYDACDEPGTVEALATPADEDIAELPPTEPNFEDSPAEPTHIHTMIDLDALLLALHENGLVLGNIEVKPYIADGRVRMNITGKIGGCPSFLDVAKINAIFKAAGGKDINLHATFDDAQNIGVGFIYEI